MKKILTVLAIVLFTINTNAQEAKPVAKETACSAKYDANSKTMTPAEMAKCQEKCKAEGKVCTAEEMAKCKKDEKKCCAKKV